jgi:hypothetical protein
MTIVNIDETTTLGQHLLRELRENPDAGTIDESPQDDELAESDELAQMDELPQMEKHPFLEFVPRENDRINKAPRDENGNIIGYTWEETREMMYGILAKHYGVDVRTL